MEDVITPNDPLSKFSLAIFAINGLLMQSGEQVTRPFGQSSARWHVLGRAGYKPQTVAQMARSIGNSRQSVQRIAHSLVRDGLAIFKSNPADKRAPLLELTEQGISVLKAIYARDQVWSSELMTQLSPQQLEQIAQSLQEIGQVLNDYIIKQEGTELSWKQQPLKMAQN